jgi:uncharacterized protein YjbJ (UPF0337 family)
MNQQIFEGNWTRMQGKLKQRWGVLTDDDLTQAEGNVDQLIGLIQKKTGETRESVEHYLDQMCAEGEGQSRTDQASQAAREYAQQASDAFHESSKHVSDAIHDGYESTERMIRERPVESLAVVFGSGLVAGVLLGLMVRSR